MTDADPPKLTRQQQLAAARTAEFVARNPGSLVVRTVVGSGLTRGKRGAVIQGLGLFLAQPRRGHLVADRTGIRMMQGLDDVEWEKSWGQITEVEEVGSAPRRLQVDAVGFYDPKVYVLCRPDGDGLRPHEASEVIARLKALGGRS